MSEENMVIMNTNRSYLSLRHVCLVSLYIIILSRFCFIPFKILSIVVPFCKMNSIPICCFIILAILCRSALGFQCMHYPFKSFTTRDPFFSGGSKGSKGKGAGSGTDGGGVDAVIGESGPDDGSVKNGTGPIEEKWIDMWLDHFHSADERKWKMRYLKNKQFFEKGGPIILFIGGEWEIQRSTLRKGQHFDIAKKHNGILFYTEHRYYGKSRPTKDTSTENLLYLTVEQALADLAYFVTSMKANIPGLEHSRTIAFGGSYSGNLAAWFRIKYPHLCYGALASSAPILAKADFYEYYEVAGKSLHDYGGQKCVDILSQGMKEIKQALNKSSGIEAVQKEFNLCSSISYDNPLDVATFLVSISSTFAYIVQYNNNDDIEKDCQLMINASNNGSSALQSVAALYRNKSDTEECTHADYKNYTDTFSDIHWDKPGTNGSMRQWLYQTCIEGGYAQTFTSTHQPFGTSDNTLEYNTQICADLFKGSFTKNADSIMECGVTRTNIVFGGLNPEITRVIFTQGSIDPWQRLGRSTDLNPESPAIYIEGASHTQDMKSLSSSDSKELRSAKLRVQHIIGKWLSS